MKISDTQNQQEEQAFAKTDENFLNAIVENSQHSIEALMAKAETDDNFLKNLLLLDASAVRRKLTTLQETIDAYDVYLAGSDQHNPDAQFSINTFYERIAETLAKLEENFDEFVNKQEKLADLVNSDKKTKAKVKMLKVVNKLRNDYDYDLQCIFSAFAVKVRANEYQKEHKQKIKDTFERLLDKYNIIKKNDNITTV